MRTQAAAPHSRLVALLGPTNTGKTHRAIVRMLEHPSGMLGLPLRLLAREVYDRITREIGEEQVALVTGEEKRVGQRARYWVCTVEAMPLSEEVDFLAVDEIQLAAHPRRGHVFTDRLLHARGRVETWFLGADTMRPLLASLLPTATFETQPRLSLLTPRGQSSLGSLPARSAVVAFNVPEVYRLAERVMRRRGGAAVVLGAFSPRARNAQVALYEAREVDYLVATDAIGMGLNLAIGHVAFASVRKFDGRQERLLLPAELAQIAGRAGRHLENGTFGTLAPAPPLPPGLQRCIAEHRFESVPYLNWRNSDLCMGSLTELIESLHLPTKRRQFRRLPPASDLEALERLAQDPDVRRRAHGADHVQLLWQACQIPNYQRWMPELHADLVKQVFLQLSAPAQALEEDWLTQALRRLDDISGDIDALTTRIAALRTWSYLAHQQDWTRDAANSIQRTLALENRLSDALHERLVERFIERRRHSVNFSGAAPERMASESGARAAPHSAPSEFALALGNLRERLFEATAPPSRESWLEDLAAAPHDRFDFDQSGAIFVREQRIARLTHGASLLRPEIKLLVDELSAGQQLRLSRRLLAWSRDLIAEITAPLRDAPEPPWSPAARGIAYQLEQNLGSLPAARVQLQLDALTPSDRHSLTERGVRLGRQAVYLAESLAPRQRWARLALVQAFAPRDPRGLPPLESCSSFAVPTHLDTDWLSSVGFIVVGPLALQADVAERVSARLRRCARTGPFALPPELQSWLGCNDAELQTLLDGLGYRRRQDGSYRRGTRRRRRRRPA
jgi:ATP-dependent RNA helicase SUPV3L1/SUV3